MSPLGPIQTAVYDLLSADDTLADGSDPLVTGVFDEVPEGQAYPYVVVGEGYETPDNAHDTFGRRTTITVHVWSDHLGFSQANTITSRVVELLDHQPLTVTGWSHVSTRFDFAQTLRDPDADVRHVAVRFVLTTETSS